MINAHVMFVGDWCIVFVRLECDADFGALTIVLKQIGEQDENAYQHSGGWLNSEEIIARGLDFERLTRVGLVRDFERLCDFVCEISGEH